MLGASSSGSTLRLHFSWMSIDEISVDRGAPAPVWQAPGMSAQRS
jgi:hypothetical protein